MPDLHVILVDQCVAELTSAPVGASLQLLFGRLDEAADQIVCASDEDYGGTALQRAAARTPSDCRRMELLRHALYRAQVYASYATSGGEGLARMQEVERVRSLLDAGRSSSS